jgi:hypothetical protein
MHQQQTMYSEFVLPVKSQFKPQSEELLSPFWNLTGQPCFAKPGNQESSSLPFGCTNSTYPTTSSMNTVDTQMLQASKAHHQGMYQQNLPTPRHITYDEAERMSYEPQYAMPGDSKTFAMH